MDRKSSEGADNLADDDSADLWEIIHPASVGRADSGRFSADDWGIADAIVAASSGTKGPAIVAASSGAKGPEIVGAAEIVGAGERKGALRPDADNWALKATGTDAGDCARGEFPCSKGAVLRALVTVAAPEAKGAGDPAALAGEAIKKLGCDSELCALNKPAFIRHAQEQGVAPIAIALEKERNFKPFGPKNSTELLNNFQIDETLQRWARNEFKDFFAHPFAMMDFHRTGDDFAAVSLPAVYRGGVAQLMGKGAPPVKRPCRTFGCVLNTDVSSGPGKHWVAVFVDMRDGGAPWSVEFFNSAGNPPPPPLVEWMERVRAELESFRGTGAVETANITKSHQRSETECGLYSLFYIRQRLVGVPRTMFTGKERITDEAMMAFRQHVFRGEK